MHRLRAKGWPPLGFWVLAVFVVVAVSRRRRGGGGGMHIYGPVADSVINQDARAQLAEAVVERGLAEPVTDEDLGVAWRALRDRAAAGDAEAAAALFAVAERQRDED